MLTRVAAVLLSAICSISAEEAKGLKTQEAKEFQITTEKKFRFQYLLHLPASYEAEGKKKWPLMLFLHGAGERGTNISRVALNGPPRLVKKNPDFEFILVSPQCPSGQTWEDESLLALLDEVTREYRVDERRMYLTGLSMGGYGTWSLGLKHPDRFAAIAPICGGGNVLRILLPHSGKQGALRKLPVWAFHGGKDEVVPVTETERMIEALRRIGNQPKLTIYPDAGHNSWTETYNNPALYEWFLQHRRPGIKPAATTAR